MPLFSSEDYINSSIIPDLGHAARRCVFGDGTFRAYINEIRCYHAFGWPDDDEINFDHMPRGQEAINNAVAADCKEGL